MKYLLMIMTSCLPFSVAALLARQPAVFAGPDSAISREAELKDLDFQRDAVLRRTLVLRAGERNFLPRQ